MAPRTPPTAPQGLSSRQSLPAGLHAAADYEALAEAALPPALWAYLAGGSGSDATVAANRAAFAATALWPRVLRELRHGHTRLTLPGLAPSPHPFLLAPVAHQGLVHTGAENATAQGAAAADAPMLLSTLSSQPLEAVAQHSRAGGGRLWFQLYGQPDRAVTLDLVRRAEAAGCEALVFTLDAPVQAPSQRALRAGFRWPAERTAPTLAAYPPVPAPSPLAGDSAVFQGWMAQAPGWADWDAVRAATRLPLWAKGVLHPEDARALRSRGADGLIVSNHGGRALDGAPASLTVLPAVRQAVGRELPLLLDSGVRSGADAFKALALGANGVLVGRLQLYALAVAGALGVAHLVKLLREELELTMALTGCATLADISPQALRPTHAPAADPH